MSDSSTQEPRARLKAILLNGALIFASLALVFAVGEIATRVLHNASPPQLLGIIEPDESLGWRPKPDINETRFERDTAGKSYDVRITTDARGFRMFGEVHSERPKIFILGDSFTFSRQTTTEKAYWHLLGKRLNAEIFVFAAPGYGTLQEYLNLDRYLDEINPDLVLWQFSTNDVINNSVELERKSIGHRFHVAKPYLTEVGSILRLNPAQGPFLRRVGALGSRFLISIAWRIDRLISTELTEENTIEAAIVREGPAHPGFQDAVRTTARIVDLIKRRCGDRMLVAFCVDSREPFYSALRDLVTTNEIPFVGAVNVALGQAADTDLVYKAADNVHWTEPGHAICAQVLSEYLIKTKHWPAN